MPKKTFPAHYAILGFLSDGPLHGYALRQYIDISLSSFWSIATSQIYSALHSIQANGLAEVELQTQHAKPSREVYMITDKGKREFNHWCENPVKHMRDMRVEFLAKLFFCLREARCDALSLIQKQKALLDRLLIRVSRRRDMFNDNRDLDILATSFRTYQITASIEWLKDCEQKILQDVSGGMDAETYQ
jgi:PadR family transcriptional regulator, regulatory protein AphA